MKPFWTSPAEPTDKGHSYRQLAQTLGVVIWNLHYKRRLWQKPCKQRQWINRCSFAVVCAIFSRQCGDCHLSPCTSQSATKFTAKVSLSLRIFRAGLAEPLFVVRSVPWARRRKRCSEPQITALSRFRFSIDCHTLVRHTHRSYMTHIPLIHGVAVVCGVNASVVFRIVYVEIQIESNMVNADGVNVF